MPNGFWALAMSAAMQVGAPGPSETPNFPSMQNAYNQHGFEGQYEQRYPVDTQQNWVHGYFQEIPAYGGHAYFRPYNYKDLLSQSQVSGGWGHSPVLPYSQQFWHKYQDQATMLKLTRTDAVPPGVAMPAQPVFLPAGSSYYRQPEFAPAPAQFYAAPAGSYVYPQEAAAPVYLPSPAAEFNGPALNGPALQPANDQQYVDPGVYTPR